LQNCGVGAEFIRNQGLEWKILQSERGWLQDSHDLLEIRLFLKGKISGPGTRSRGHGVVVIPWFTMDQPAA
jgi:hypothetical protein